MTERETIRWITTVLGPIVDRAIDFSRQKNPALLYTRDWLTGMCYRETGFLINRYVTQKLPVATIHTLMKGDYSQRQGETEKSYHGFGYWQIDIGSFPDFVKSGDWKDPYKTCVKAISVLEGKRIFLQKKLQGLVDERLHRAITAAYNCGEGNVLKALTAGKDVDIYTHQDNYSAEVWRFREIAKLL
jgi:hypothetical protein